MGSNQSIYEKKINLKNKGLKNIDTDIKRFDLMKSFKSPKSLTLSYNKLTVLNPDICEEFSRLKNIHENLLELNLSHNKISFLPDTFLLLINLSNLRLDHNEIDIIPEKFADCLYNLQDLSLNHNKIKKIPWNFNKLRQLKIVHLNNNQIDYIPNTFGELHLEDMSLHNNPLSDELFMTNTVDGILEAIMLQRIPREYRPQVQKLIEDWEVEGKGKSESERQFLYFLQQDEFRGLLFKYMEKEVSHENLDFWQRVDRFKWRYSSIYEIRTPDLIKEAVDIFKLFIADNAPHSINIPASEGVALRKIFNDTFYFPQGINQWVFDGSYEAVLKLMYSDTFSRYRLTEEGNLDFTKAVQMWESLPVNRIRRLGSIK